MTFNLFKRRPPKVDPEELMRKAEDSIAHVEGQQDHVNALTSYLIWRTGDNGFGQDFEYTLRPKGASS